MPECGGADACLEVTALERDAVLLVVRRTCSPQEALTQLLGSKAAARRVLAAGKVLRAGQPVAPTATLAAGDALTLRFCRAQGLRDSGDAPVDVLYQDPVLLAADKPAPLLVHGDGTGASTLTARVRAHLARQGLPARAQAVQRLDVETTGIVLFSLTEEFQPALDALVAGHDLRKRYLAVVEGRVAAGERDWLELTGPLGRDRHDARRMRVSATGKPALTRVRTLGHSGGRSLLLVELGSGRRHQIRVHLAHAGHPLLGDVLYGGASHADGLMLHAWEERLAHPVTGELLELRAPIPARFTRLFPSLT